MEKLLTVQSNGTIYDMPPINKQRYIKTTVAYSLDKHPVFVNLRREKAIISKWKINTI